MLSLLIFLYTPHLIDSIKSIQQFPGKSYLLFIQLQKGYNSHLPRIDHLLMNIMQEIIKEKKGVQCKLENRKI